MHTIRCIPINSTICRQIYKRYQIAHMRSKNPLKCNKLSSRFRQSRPRGGFSTEAEPSRGQLYFNRGRAEPRNKLVDRGLTNFGRGRGLSNFYLARKYHSTPPGSAAPERLFSTAMQISKPTRLNMKPVNLESNLFLKRNFALFDKYGSCPDGFTAPNSADIPSSKYGPMDDDDSELSDIICITDDEE